MSPETTTTTKTQKKKKKKKKTKKKTKTKVEKQLLKEKFIRLVRRKLIENATFRRAFVNANEYNKIAQSVRVAFREENDDEDDDDEEKEKMLHFLDSKSHFLFVVDKVVGQKSKDDDDEEEEDVHVNLTEPLETWLRVKNYHRNKFKKLGENAAATIKEKQKAKREAKERVNKARMEKKEKETKEKERKERKRKYHVDLEYYRHKGTCLDWVNTGTCRFGSECTYAHDEEAKGKLIEAAREVEAKTGRERGLRGEYADAKQKKRKREDVLLGDFDDDFDDDDDDDKNDTIVPGFLKAQMKKSSKARKDDEEERPTLSIRERKLLEKKMKTNANTNGKKNKKFDKTKRVVGRKTPTNNTTKANGVAVTKKKKKERHPDGRHAKRSRARLEQIQ